MRSWFKPGPGQTWTDFARQGLSFALGVIIVVYGVFYSDNSLVPELVVGLLLMGVIPVDTVLARLGLGTGGPAPASEPPADAGSTVEPEQ